MNPFAQLLRSRGAQPAIGTWVLSASPLVAEAVGLAGFDWGVLDMEHTPLDLMGLVQLLQAVGNTKMVPVVRVPSNDAVTVKRVLDAGALTLLFPMVQSAAEAQQAVASTRYPPQGVRGLATSAGPRALAPGPTSCARPTPPSVSWCNSRHRRPSRSSRRSLPSKASTRCWSGPATWRPRWAMWATPPTPR